MSSTVTTGSGYPPEPYPPSSDRLGGEVVGVLVGVGTVMGAGAVVWDGAGTEVGTGTVVGLGIGTVVGVGVGGDELVRVTELSSAADGVAAAPARLCGCAVGDEGGGAVVGVVVGVAGAPPLEAPGSDGSFRRRGGAPIESPGIVVALRGTGIELGTPVSPITSRSKIPVPMVATPARPNQLVLEAGPALRASAPEGMPDAVAEWPKSRERKTSSRFVTCSPRSADNRSPISY